MDKCGFSDCGKEEATGFGYKVWYSTTQNPLKQPKKNPKPHSSFGSRHEHVDLEPEMAACVHTTVHPWHCMAMVLQV